MRVINKYETENNRILKCIWSKKNYSTQRRTSTTSRKLMGERVYVIVKIMILYLMKK